MANALELLGCFTRKEAVLTVSELARRVGISRTAALRLLVTLERYRLLERVPGDRGYRLGLRAFELGALYLDAHPGSDLLYEAVDDLAEATGYSVYLGVVDGGDAVILYYREGRSPVRFVWGVGSRLPATTTALGKAILAHLPESEVDALVGTDELRGLTEASLRTRAELDVQLAEIRARGWSLARGESHESLTSIGAAVLGRRGVPLVGISVSLLDHPPHPERVERAGTAVCQVAHNLSARMATYEQYGVTPWRPGVRPDSSPRPGTGGRGGGGDE